MSKPEKVHVCFMIKKVNDEWLRNRPYKKGVMSTVVDELLDAERLREQAAKCVVPTS